MMFAALTFVLRALVFSSGMVWAGAPREDAALAGLAFGVCGIGIDFAFDRVIYPYVKKRRQQ